MILDDLHYIFKTQIDAGETKLYFMVIDGEHKEVLRHESKHISDLVPMLSSFQYIGCDQMPRFSK
jgi:hypothetical protein